MRLRLKCEKPEDVEYTVTVTMTAGQWEKVRDALDKGGPLSYPAQQLVGGITDVLAQARKIYWHSPSDSAGGGQ